MAEMWAWSGNLALGLVLLTFIYVAMGLVLLTFTYVSLGLVLLTFTFVALDLVLLTFTSRDREVILVMEMRSSSISRSNSLFIVFMADCLVTCGA